ETVPDLFRHDDLEVVFGLGDRQVLLGKLRCLRRGVAADLLRGREKEEESRVLNRAHARQVNALGERGLEQTRDVAGTLERDDLGGERLHRGGERVRDGCLAWFA